MGLYYLHHKIDPKKDREAAPSFKELLPMLKFENERWQAVQPSMINVTT